MPKLASLPRPLAVAFDLDGTLIDSREDIARACNHVLVWAGRAALPVSTVAGFVGDGARTLLARAFDVRKDAEEIEPLLAEWTRFYAAHPIERTTWMPGAKGALDAVAAAGLRAALITNKARVVTSAILAALGVSDRFAAVYAGGDGPLKPDPEPVRSVARALGIRPEELWMVGDGVQDVGAGRAAGAPTIGVLGGFHAPPALERAGPTVTLASLARFPELLSG